MKKLLICVSLFTLHFSLLSAQSFQAGSLITSLGFGLDVYSTSTTSSYHDANGNSTTPTTSSGGAATTTYSLGGEFGVLNWLGLGLQGKFDDYIKGKGNDSTTGIASAYGFEIGAIINFHILRHLHFDLLGGFDLGYSNFTITSNDGFNDQVYGSGSWVDLHLTTRIYAGRFGFNASLVFPRINYPNLTSNNTSIPLGTSVLASFKAHGEGLNIGVQYHFLK